jgi:hypothetical protein
MSIDALKQEMEALDVDRRNEMIAYLVSLNDRDNPERLAEIARKLDDKDPSHWIPLEEVERRLGLGPFDKAE